MSWRAAEWKSSIDFSLCLVTRLSSIAFSLCLVTRLSSIDFSLCLVTRLSSIDFSLCLVTRLSSDRQAQTKVYATFLAADSRKHMLIIPAIDLRQGKCVRLAQGRKDSATAYDVDPLDVA